VPFVPDEHGFRVRLRDYLGARLAPLAILLMGVVGISAPSAFYVLGRNELRVQARATAHQVTEVIKQDAQERPQLWKYDSVKLVAHLQSYLMHESIERIDFTDAAGRLVNQPREQVLEDVADRPLLWESMPVKVNNETVGTVWVAASKEDLRRNAVLLFLAFGALGGLLGGLMYGLPMRAVVRAERRIQELLQQLEDSQAALARQSESLEHQVEERSAELTKALAELREKEQNLREISMRAVVMQESERRGIARELHDSAGQALTAIRIHLQLIENAVEGADDPRSRRLKEIAARTGKLVDDTVEEIRRAVNQLGPAVLDDVGLCKAIERAADDLAEATQTRVTLDLDVPPDLDAAVESTCYRLVQVALTNVARHADAGHVPVEVGVRGSTLRVVVDDDGHGFDPAAVAPTSRGLVGMRERVELLGGELGVTSSPDGGTRIEASLPLGSRATDLVSST